MSTSIDRYFADAKNWSKELTRLREILLECDLDEDLKWGKPCYGFEGENIAILQPMKNVLALMFFKGALLDDPDQLLEAPGSNSRSGRRFRFQTVEDIETAKDAIGSFVAEAIEKSGTEIEKPDAIELPPELINRLDEDTELKAAFDALTPGRQRGYGLYVAGAKQAATRLARIDKYRPRILEGKGMHDR